MSKQNFKYLQNGFFTIFKGFSVVNNCLIPENVPLKKKHTNLLVSRAEPLVEFIISMMIVVLLKKSAKRSCFYFTASIPK